MTSASIARTGSLGTIAPREGRAGESPLSKAARPVLSSASGETTIHLMERPHIVCSKRGAPGCVERSWYEEREQGDTVTGWWCLDHAIERIEQVDAEEAASVKAAYEWLDGQMRRAS